MTTWLQTLRPHHYFAIGQIALGLSLLLCLVIIPRYFFRLDQGGVSNYGTEQQTVWLFVFGFGAAALGALLAAARLPTGVVHRRRLQFELVVLAVLYLAVLFSTFSYKDNEAYRQLHVQAALVLFVWMLTSALWLRFVVVRDVIMKRLFIVLAVGFVLSGLTFLGYLHVLFTAQLVSGIAFGYMMTHGMKVLVSKK